MNLLKITTSLLILSLIYSCSKDEDMDPATLKIEFDFSVGGEDLEFGKVYTINGDAVSFDVANYYIGGISFGQANGTTINLTDQYLLGGLQNSATLSNEIERSDITDVKFFIGVDPSTNSQSETDFTSRPSSDPLGIQDPSMHWNWNTGYKFVRFDGDVDTDGDGTVDTGVAYHLGSDAMLKNLEYAANVSIDEGENTLTFSFDLAQFFTGVDLSTELDTHTGNNLPLATRLRDNLDNAISIQ